MATSQYNSVDQTVAIFDGFYNLNLNVSATEYDVVYSYFKGVSENTTIAGNFTVVLFRIANDGNYNVLDLLAIIKGQSNKLQMNKVLCYYLNTFKAKASLYGVSNVPKPNQVVQRNVVL
jgi:hypothetical protein